jgi:hypothetical protein
MKDHQDTPMNTTKYDAFLRVLDARTGSLAGPPTAEYLYKLRAELYIWIEAVEAAIARQDEVTS